MCHDTTQLKRCKKCGRDLPADRDHFYHVNGYLSSPCKECLGRRFGHRVAVDPESSYRNCTKCGRLLELTPNNFHRSSRNQNGFVSVCKNCRRPIYSEYQKRNPEKNRERQRCWRKSNPEKAREAYRRGNAKRDPEKRRESSRRWYHENSTRIKLRVTEWQRVNRDKRYTLEHQRRARKRALAHTLTALEWTRCLDYFNHCCAVCGKPSGLWNTIAQDHWIPLSKGGDYTTGNIIPLCHAMKDGEGGCNNSKAKADPVEWLRRKYPKRWRRILARIEAYFQWVKEQDGE